MGSVINVALRCCRSRIMRVKWNLTNTGVIFTLLLLIKIIARKQQSPSDPKINLILQSNPFDDKSDSSFDKFQRANDILHGKRTMENSVLASQDVEYEYDDNVQKHPNEIKEHHQYDLKSKVFDE